jgi:hypothetical protein
VSHEGVSDEGRVSHKVPLCGLWVLEKFRGLSFGIGDTLMGMVWVSLIDFDIRIGMLNLSYRTFSS